MTSRPPVIENVFLHHERTRYAIMCARSLVAGDGLFYHIKMNTVCIFYENTCIGAMHDERLSAWISKGWQFMCTVQDNYVCGIAAHVHMDLRFTPLGKPQQHSVMEKEKEIENV